jgi:signal peptidase I
MEPNEQSGPAAETPTDGGRPRFRFTQRTREPQPQHPAQQEQRHGSNRETIESVVIAFVLAFLFRTFEAEAFVIPTGSMAPTLMGRHKEVTCQECGWVFTVGNSEDQEQKHGPLTRCVCPNCRFENDITEHLSFKGDRILVLKSLYDLPQWAPEWLREPKRWDVVVFKFPEKPEINYIKRLVGLPDEELRTHYGNIYTRTDSGEFQIARKSAEKQSVMRMLVYDNDHQSPTWRAAGWPSRWGSDSGELWKESDDGRSFESPSGLGESIEWARLAYHHLIKSWDANNPGGPPREQLITDFYGYNNDFREWDPLQPHWVGDLALSIRADVTAAKGKLRLELVEAGDRFVCEFDLVAGTCRLLRLMPDEIEEQVLATARQGIVRPGRYSICFGNTDDRLTVWLDDRLLFDDGYDYDGPGLGARQRPTLDDLRPASVAVQGTHVRVGDLVLYRDIYYTHAEHGAAGATEYDIYHPSGDWDSVLSEPTKWDVFSTARTSSFAKLGPDDFMMMGDNSPKSADGRLWPQGAKAWANDVAREQGLDNALALDEIAKRPGGEVVQAPEHVVRRQLLIGRAFYVYWPHAVPFGPDWLQFDTPKLGPLGSFRLPFHPNISRMKMIE